MIYGWHKDWEKDGAGGIPEADRQWLKEDPDRGMFVHQMYGQGKRRKELKEGMWFYPPDPPGFFKNQVCSGSAFFRNKVFVWRPVGVWNCSFKCLNGAECAAAGEKGRYLTRGGYHNKARSVINVSTCYTMLTEVLQCGPCKDAKRSSKFLAWDDRILSQLTAGQQARFPAVLTQK